MQSKLIFILNILNLIGNLAFAFDSSNENQRGPQKILQIVNSQDEGETPLLFIENLSLNPLIEGDIVEIKREFRPRSALYYSHKFRKEILITIAKAKVVEINDSLALAYPFALFDSNLAVYFPKFKRLMAGDRVEKIRQDFVQKISLATPLVFSFEDLFYEGSLELSLKGREKLKDLAKELSSLRIESLLIEAYFYKPKTRSEAQKASKDYAQVVKTFLVQTLGFEKARLIAVGMGSKEKASPEELENDTQSSGVIIFKLKENLSP